jgi:DNA-binding NarL/FixJ family response regulator
MRLKILFVENHSVFARTVVAQFLAKHDVSVVPSLFEARHAQNVYDLILVDFDLDDGKGDEFVREIRCVCPKMKIIGVSAREAGNEALLRAGADAVCGKMEFDQIDQIINKVFEE